MTFERVLNARFPTVSDIKLKAWQTGILKTLGAWRYKFRFYSAPGRSVLWQIGCSSIGSRGLKVLRSSE